jgi:hypothetical protein
MEEKKQHHGREDLSTAIGVIAEIVAIKYGVVWLTWFAALFFCLAVFGYTAKWVRDKRKRGWLVRGVAVLVILLVAVLITLPKHQPTAAATKEPDPIPVTPPRPVPQPPPTHKAPSRSEKSPPQVKPVAPPTVNQNCPNGICNGGDNYGNQQVNNYGPPKLTLTPDKLQQLTIELKPLAGKQVGIVVVSGNADLFSLRDQFLVAFQQNQIQGVRGEVGEMFPVPPDGVSLLVSGDGKFDTDELNVLAAALISVGLAKRPVGVGRSPLINSGGIGVQIAPMH